MTYLHCTSVFDLGRFSIRLNWLVDDEMFGFVFPVQKYRKCIIFNLRTGITTEANYHALYANEENERELALCDLGTWYNQYVKSDLNTNVDEWAVLSKLQRSLVFDKLFGTLTTYPFSDDTRGIRVQNYLNARWPVVDEEEVAPRNLDIVQEDILNMLLDWKLKPVEIIQIIKGKGYVSNSGINPDKDVIKYVQGSRHHGVTLKIKDQVVTAARWIRDWTSRKDT